MLSLLLMNLFTDKSALTEEQKENNFYNMY
jgi:hypothetical protein